MWVIEEGEKLEQRSLSYGRNDDDDDDDADGGNDEAYDKKHKARV